MPAPPDLHSRTAAPRDTAAVDDGVAPILEHIETVWWLHPTPAARAPSAREHPRRHPRTPVGSLDARVVPLNPWRTQDEPRPRPNDTDTAVHRGPRPQALTINTLPDAPR